MTIAQTQLRAAPPAAETPPPEATPHAPRTAPTNDARVPFRVMAVDCC